MCIDHRRAHIFVPKQLLNGPDVVSILEQVRCKTVPQRVTGASLRNTGFDNRLFDGSLDQALMKMMAPLISATGVN